MEIKKKDLSYFIGRQQLNVMLEFAKGEEGEHFIELAKTFAKRVETMPKVYEQDGLGDQAIVYLHYFKSGCDWHITERDTTQVQRQAFGLANLGYGAELGYISIAEIIAAGGELDLYFEPKTIALL